MFGNLDDGLTGGQFRWLHMCHETLARWLVQGRRLKVDFFRRQLSFCSRSLAWTSMEEAEKTEKRWARRIREISDNSRNLKASMDLYWTWYVGLSSGYTQLMGPCFLGFAEAMSVLGMTWLGEGRPLFTKMSFERFSRFSIAYFTWGCPWKWVVIIEVVQPLGRRIICTRIITLFSSTYSTGILPCVTC